jgi:enoyl-CoA hydratase/carnithine racemase
LQPEDWAVPARIVAGLCRLARLLSRPFRPASSPGYAAAVTLQIDDKNRVRTLTLNRPDALNAFNEALYDATAEALLAAADDPEVAVVLVTGAGRAFSAGTDLAEMQARVTDPHFLPGKYGFTGLIDALSRFPKPLICAVNGLGVGIGATILGYADLAFMSSTARLKCPFTSLGVAPEAASSYLLPQLVGRQNAAWLLMSSEWVDAQEALRMGLVWKVCEPSDLLAEARRHAEILAARPISSLIAVKNTIVEPIRPEIAAASARENAYFAELLGKQANAEALADFTAGRGN